MTGVALLSSDDDVELCFLCLIEFIVAKWLLLEIMVEIPTLHHRDLSTPTQDLSNSLCLFMLF